MIGLPRRVNPKRRSLLALIAASAVPANALATAQQMLLGMGAAAVPAAWSSVTALPAARDFLAATGPSNTAVLIPGGANATPAGQTDVWSWDGASYTTQTSLPTGNYNSFGCAGTTTAAMLTGGVNAFGTRTFNGTSWTTQGDIPDGRGSFGKSGGISVAGLSSSAAIEGGGLQNNNGFDTNTAAKFNGASWTAIATLAHPATGRSSCGMAGTATTAVIFGGHGANTATDIWNNTSWTAGGAFVTGGASAAPSGTGASGSSALGTGSGTSSGGAKNCQSFDGAVWTSLALMNVSHQRHGSAGNPTSAYVVGGSDGSAPIATASKFQ